MVSTYEVSQPSLTDCCNFPSTAGRESHACWHRDFQHAGSAQVADVGGARGRPSAISCPVKEFLTCCFINLFRRGRPSVRKSEMTRSVRDRPARTGHLQRPNGGDITSPDDRCGVLGAVASISPSKAMKELGRGQLFREAMRS